MSCRALASLSLILILSGAGCARKETHAVERLAVLPLENLSGDGRSDWAGRAAASALMYDLAGAPELLAETVDSITAAYNIGPSRILQGYFVERNGQIELRLTLQDVQRTQTVAVFSLDGSAAAGLLPLVNQVARQLSPHARVFSTANAGAFRLYGEARQGRDLAEVQHGLESAIAADPRFLAAYIDLAKARLASGDKAAALQTIQSALSLQPDAIDAARLEFLAATARTDAAARVAALEKLAKLTPADSSVLQELAALQLAQRRFAGAVQSYRAAAQAMPENAELWNELGYALAHTGDLKEARVALEHYRQLLPPENTNGLDSLGEVSFYLGDFAAAEKYFLSAQAKNPAAQGGSELLKAAQARLLAGDLPGADALFQRYLGTAQPAQKAVAELQHAQWLFLTGRRKAGIDSLEKLIGRSTAELQSLALCQLSLWKLEAGDDAAASNLAKRAAAQAAGPRSHALAEMVRVIGARGSVKSGAALPDACALLFARKYAEAVPLLEDLYRETNPSLDGQVRALLAWAYLRAGRTADAAKLVRLYPLPVSTGDTLFASLVFPRFLQVRGTVLHSQPDLQLYSKFSGDLPDIFDK